MPCHYYNDGIYFTNRIFNTDAKNVGAFLSSHGVYTPLLNDSQRHLVPKKENKLMAIK